MAYREVKPRQYVEVQIDGTWWPAELRAWRYLPVKGMWEGFITYTTRDEAGLPENRLAWFPETDLREVQESS